ncbi:MAG: hypothetical protein Q4G68_12200 [Planctomycetia bacterium]|nr:hypothetical protein [Planctomycetia bacterium]
MTQVDIVSFFLFSLLFSGIVFPFLWNYSFRSMDLPRLTIKTGLYLVATWCCFTVSCLVLLQCMRNLLEPGIWEREMLFRGLQTQETAGTRTILVDLLFGWLLFPIRVIPEVTCNPQAIATGLVILALIPIVIDLSGRLFVKRAWRVRWDFMLPAGVMLMYLVSFSATGLVRQLGWLLF